MAGALNDDVTQVLGAAFITFVLGSMLYGITLSQVYQYFKMYPKDPWIIKAMIAFVCLIDTLHSVFSINMMWAWLVIGIGNDIAHARVIWSIKAVGYLHVSIMLFVQGVYLYRIFLFARKGSNVHVRLFTGVIVQTLSVFGGLLALAAVVVYLVEVQRAKVLLDFASGAKWIVYFAFAVTCAVDIGITIGMCSLLHNSRIKVEGVESASNASNVVLTKIIIFFISSGLLTTIIAVVYMAIFSALPDVLLFLASTCSTSKLYANSVLALFNGRRHLRSTFEKPRDIEHLSSLEFRPQGTGESSTTMSLSPIEDKRRRSYSGTHTMPKR